MGYQQQQQQQPYGRPPPPPPQQMMMMGQPYASPQPPQPPMMDSAYLPESSVLAANQAGRQGQSNPFPPPSMENLQQFRAEAQASNDPSKMLDLAKYMMEVVPVVCAANAKDPKRARKIKETLVLEAQKIVKKLASSSGLGKTGYGEAQFYLADCYGSGKLGLAVDVDKAFSLYLQGSKQSHPACTYRVAVCYELGAGTKKDNAHAIQFFRKAANLGDGRAMYKLSMVLLRGNLGQPKNPREGMSWLERAATQADEDHPQPIHDLGVAFEKEGIPSVIPDPNYARDLFTRAAQYGYAPSQFKLGLAYENGFLNCPIDPRRSIAW
jgi:TPR repeat protein